ncbi:hypothetical protein EHI8A_032750 [Entamoeba histolytica HM-1:IMSS-B]|uniref:Uncharacterized protein n=3 Tax=Entamoeba histolytica TaxID=5759 RepID=A0A175JES4_ENTHI|nr:hypothetical protein EHI8A_032750 [Entamoeba histolytica HM-1:IMSS-B]ENY65166.1 hypothetical protein EHI7A_035420 [Entamoeba histolytica HM-1:IMSS-A]GAT91974.1 hypothetical protein CL6EHI_050450 [Entamoeba histolytica]
MTFLPYNEDEINLLLKQHNQQTFNSTIEEHHQKELSSSQNVDIQLTYEKLIDKASDYHCQITELKEVYQGNLMEKESLEKVNQNLNNDINSLQNQIIQIKQLYFNELIDKIGESGLSLENLQEVFLQLIIKEIPLSSWKEYLINQYFSI